MSWFLTNIVLRLKYTVSDWWVCYVCQSFSFSLTMLLCSRNTACADCRRESEAYESLETMSSFSAVNSDRASSALTLHRKCVSRFLKFLRTEEREVLRWLFFATELWLFQSVLSVGGSHVLQNISQGFQWSTHHWHRVVNFMWLGELQLGPPTKKKLFLHFNLVWLSKCHTRE